MGAEGEKCCQTPPKNAKSVRYEPCLSPPKILKSKGRRIKIWMHGLGTLPQLLWKRTKLKGGTKRGWMGKLMGSMCVCCWNLLKKLYAKIDGAGIY